MDQIETFDMNFLVNRQDLIIDILKRCPKRIFFDNYHMFRLYEYLKCYQVILDKFDYSDKFTYLDVGSCRSFFPFFVAEMFPNALVIMSDMAPIDSYFIYDKPTYPKNLIGQYSDIQNLSQYVGVNSVDIISCISVIEHVDDEAKAYNEMLKCLKPDGVLCVTTDIDTVTPQDFHPRRYDEALFRTRQQTMCDKLPRYIDVNKDTQSYKVDENKRIYDNKISLDIRDEIELYDLHYLAGFFTVKKSQ